MYLSGLDVTPLKLEPVDLFAAWVSTSVATAVAKVSILAPSSEVVDCDEIAICATISVSWLNLLLSMF